MKRAIIVALVIFAVCGSNSLAKSGGSVVIIQTNSPTVTSEKGYFFGENNEFWARVTTKQQSKVAVYSVPERPKKVSLKDANRLYLGEKSQIPYKECKTKYLGFMQGIKALTTCVNQTASLKSKESLEIQLSKPTTSHPPAGKQWFVWPMICVAGILSLALIFIARGAPATFLMQYGMWIMGSLAGEALLVFWIDHVVAQVVIAGIAFAIVMAFGLFGHRNLVEEWCNKKPELDRTTICLGLLEILWIFCGILAINIMFAVIPDITVQIDFAFFIFSWLICATIAIFVANQFPNFAKKYLSWI